MVPPSVKDELVTWSAEEPDGRLSPQPHDPRRRSAAPSTNPMVLIELVSVYSKGKNPPQLKRYRALRGVRFTKAKY
jgi:hypothetical protein